MYCHKVVVDFVGPDFKRKVYLSDKQPKVHLGTEFAKIIWPPGTTLSIHNSKDEVHTIFAKDGMRVAFDYLKNEVELSPEVVEHTLPSPDVVVAIEEAEIEETVETA